VQLLLENNDTYRSPLHRNVFLHKLLGDNNGRGSRNHIRRRHALRGIPYKFMGKMPDYGKDDRMERSHSKLIATGRETH